MSMVLRLIMISLYFASFSSFANPVSLQNDNAKLNIYVDNFLAISCDKTGNLCIAVGQETNSQGSLIYKTYKTQDAGLNWSSPVSLLPVENETISTKDPDPVHISCDSSGQHCILVHTPIIGAFPAPVVYRTSNGGVSWSEPSVLPLPPTAQNKTGSAYSNISCDGSGSSCMIAGNLTTDTEAFPMLYTTKDAGQQWSLVTSLKEPDRTYDHIVSLFSVNCDDSGLFCMAVGYALTRDSFWSFNYSAHPLVYTTENGGANWSDPVVLPKDNSGNTSSALYDVACSVSGGHCTALGFINDDDTGLSQSYTFTTMNRGVEWQNQTLLTQFDEKVFFASLDCDVTGKNCTAVGGRIEDMMNISPRIYRTVDGAKTWVRNTQDISPSYSILQDIFCSKVDDSCITVGFDLHDDLIKQNLRHQKNLSLTRRTFLPSLVKSKIVKEVK